MCRERRRAARRAARTAALALAAAQAAACTAPPPGADERTARRADPLTIQVIGNRWRPLGPAAIAGGQTSGGPRGDVTGRISTIAVNPQNQLGDIWVGAATGGVWRGRVHPSGSWTPVGDALQTLAIGVIRPDPASCGPTRCNTVWVGTGESSIRRDTQWGVGVYRADWNNTTGRYDWTGPLGGAHFRRGSITGMVLDPDTAPGGSKRIFVTLSSGISANATQSSVQTTPAGGYGVWRSEDNGASWTRVLATNGPATDLELDPGNDNTLYAGARGEGFYRSTSNGALNTWTPINLNIPAAAVTASDWAELTVQRNFGAPSSTLYGVLGDCPSPFSESGTSCSPAVYRSQNGGNSWSEVFSAANNSGFLQPLNSYVSYTHALTVHPGDPNTVWYGGTGLYRSTNGGANWMQIGKPTHPDHHVLLPIFDDAIDGGFGLINGNDGGFYFSVGDDSFSDAYQHGLETVQFQSIAMRDGFLIGGTQDNGVLRYDGGEVWEHIQDSDGASTVLDNDTPGQALSIRYNMPPYRSPDVSGAHNWGWAGSGIVENPGPTTWYPPIGQDHTPLASGQHTFYTATTRLYRSTTPQAPTWTSMNLTPPASSTNPPEFPVIDSPNVVTAFAVAPSDSNRMYVGYYGGQVYTTLNALAPTPTWTAVHAAPLPARPITAIAVHPTDPLRVVVAFTGFGSASVYQSSTAGGNWSAYSTHNDPDPNHNFATEPVNALLIEPQSPHRIWAGTDRGVYYRATPESDANTWQRSTAGLPNVGVYAFAIDDANGAVYAATHGRGVWSLSRRPYLKINIVLCCGCIDLYCPAPPIINVLASQFDPNERCAMTLYDQRGAACGPASELDGDGGLLHTDANGVLVTTREGAYTDRPMAYACSGGMCAGGIPATRCNVARVQVACGARAATEAAARPAMRRDPASTTLALTPQLPDGATGGAFELRALMRRNDGRAQQLCAARVAFARGDTTERVLESAAAAVNADAVCQRAGVRAQVTGAVASTAGHPEDPPSHDPRLQLSAPALEGVQLFTGVTATADLAASVDGVGDPVRGGYVPPRVSLAGTAAGGVVRVTERTPLGRCTVQVAARAGEGAASLAARVRDAFLAPPAAPPRVLTATPDACPARRNARDVTLAGATLTFGTARQVLVETTDRALSFTVDTE